MGESGSAGLRKAALAAPNGYTLLVTTNAALITLMINPKLSVTAYDTPKDFEPIAYLGSTPNVIVTRPSSGIASIADLIAKAKANPGKLTCGSPGFGTSSGVSLELLKLRANIDIMQIGLDGSDPALMALLGGGTDIAAIGIGNMVDRIQSEKIKALVQTGGERWPGLPDVPTMAEAGIPDAVVETSEMFAAPAGTPSVVIDRLMRATQEILLEPSVQAKMFAAGFRVRYEGPEELRARVLREIPVWKEIVERAGLKK